MKKNLKKLFVAVAILFLIAALGFTGCAPAEKQPLEEPSGEKESPKITQKINYITNPSGTGFYTIAVGQAKVLNDNTGLEITVQPSSGATAIPGLVGAKEGMLGLATSSTGAEALEGSGSFDEPHPFMMALQSGHSMLFGILTHEGTGIKSVEDLRGKKFTWDIPTHNVGRNLGYWVLKGYGLDPEKDVIPMKAEFAPDAVDDLIMGRTDATVGSLTGSKMEELASKYDTVVLPLEPDKLDLLNENFPGVLSGLTPDGIPKVEAGIPIIVTPAILFAHKDLDEEVAYLVVKTLIENQKELETVHQDFAEWTAENAVKTIPLLYHPGAIKYYKEVGLWTEEAENHQNKLLEKYEELIRK